MVNGNTKWFKHTLNNRDYMIHKDSGLKKIISKDGKYLRKGEKDSELIEQCLKYKTFPTLLDIFGISRLSDWEDQILLPIFVNDLGYTLDEYKENNVERFKADPPILKPLYPIWRNTRDANWLYSHPDYVFETLHCAKHVTVKVGSKGDIYEKYSSFMNTLILMEMLEFDSKENFKCLDLCSGLGLSTIFLASRFPNGTFYYNELNKRSRLVFSKILAKTSLTNVVILSGEEIDEELDIVIGFEAVEHIPHPTLKGVGQPFNWVKKFLDKIVDNGYFLYATQWSAEMGLDGDCLGHFLQYEIDGKVVGLDPMVNGGKPIWGKLFNQELEKYGFRNLQGKKGCGYKGLKWSFRGAPCLFKKT